MYFMPIHGGLRPIEKYSLSRILSWRRLCYGVEDNAVEITFETASGGTRESVQVRLI